MEDLDVLCGDGSQGQAACAVSGKAAGERDEGELAVGEERKNRVGDGKDSLGVYICCRKEIANAK